MKDGEVMEQQPQSQQPQQAHELTSQVTYNPDNLLDSLIERLNLKNDAALSRALEVAPPVISKIRHRRLPVGASMLIRMHEVSNMDIRELRELMGDRRTKYRLSDAQGKPKPADAQAKAKPQDKI
jgi:plasmid maintenance system antidote protein VapI